MRPAAIACAFAVVATGCGNAVDDAAPTVDSALDEITTEALKKHYTYLADDALEGRMTGQPGYDAAAAYVADQLASFGVEPAGEDGWYQQVPLIAYRLDLDTPTLIVHRDGGDVALDFRDDYVMGGDKVRDSTSVRAEVVYVGYGVHAPELGYSDYDGIDVDGKIIALFGGAPGAFPHNERAYYASSRTKYEEAAARGAVGAVLLRSRRSAQNVPWERVKKQVGIRPGMAWVSATGSAADYFPQIQAAVLLNDDAAHDFFRATPISFKDALEAAANSRPASVPLGFEVTLSQASTRKSITSPNVVGIVRGSDPELADQFVVYSAHLDHLGRGVAENGDDIYNGAYDNAMGVALMLETARAFALKPPRRSVLFVAVTAEERGLLGSDYFAHYPTVPREAIVANVNLDMPLFLYPLADLIAFGSEHSTLEAIVSEAARAEGFALTPDPMPEETLFIRSDQYSFVRKGIPSIFLVPGNASTDAEVDGQARFRDFILNHYHRPADDLSRPVDWESARRFARANMRIGTIVGNDDGRPQWKDGDFFGERFGDQR